MQKNKIISVFLLLVLVLLIAGILICINNKSKSKIKNNQKTSTIITENFYSTIEKKDIRYKNLHNMFMFLTILQEDSNINLKTVLDEQGYNWITKFKPHIFRREINTIDLRIIFKKHDDGYRDYFYYEQINLENSLETAAAATLTPNAAVEYNEYILRKHYLITNDETFKLFIQTIEDTLIYHSEENLHIYNIADDYEGNSLYSQLIEMLFVSAYIPNALEHMYLMPYNLLLKTFSATFTTFEDYVMFGQLYSCANQMNLSSNNICEQNGIRLGAVNFVVDITKYEKEEDENAENNIPISSKTSDFLGKIKFMFYKTNNELNHLVMGLQSSFVQFYLALQYFSKKFGISKNESISSNSGYETKFKDKDKINENVRMDMASKNSYDKLITSYNNQSINSPLNLIIELNRVDKLFESDAGKLDVSGIIYVQDYDNFFYFLSLSYDVILSIMLNLSLSDFTKNPLPTDSPSAVTKKLDIIRSFYKMITISFSIPLDNIYFANPSDSILSSIFIDTQILSGSESTNVKKSEIYGRFLSYYQTLQNIRSYTNTQSVDSVKVGNAVFNVNSEYDSPSDVNNLIKLLRYFKTYQIKRDQLFDNVQIDNSNSFILDLIKYINDKKTYLFYAYNPNGLSSINPPYPAFILLVKYVFSTSVDIHDDNQIIIPQNVAYLNSRTDLNNLMQNAYNALNEFIMMYSKNGKPVNDRNDQYTFIAFTLTLCITICPLLKLYDLPETTIKGIFNEIDYYIFINMRRAVLKLITDDSISKIMKSGLHPGIDRVTNDPSNDPSKPPKWNVHLYKDNYYYRLNLENNIIDNSNPSDIREYSGLLSNNSNLIYVYYCILYFITNPNIIV